MRFRLRTLLIILAIGPPLLAWFLAVGCALCFGTSVWHFVGLVEVAVFGLIVAAALASVWLAVALILRERKLYNLHNTIEHNRKELENTRLKEELWRLRERDAPNRP